MRLFLLLTYLLFSLMSCQEVFVPNIDETKPILVVEGFFCTNPEQNIVTVSLSGPINSNLPNKFISDLKVFIIDNNGKRIDYHENTNGSGIYVTENNISSSAKIGNTYILYIESKEGNIYKSTPQTVNKSPEIEDVYIKPDNQLVLIEDSYGNIKEQNRNGAAIYSSTDAILPKDNYYLYRWSGYEQQHLIFTCSNASSEIYKHRPIAQTYVQVIKTANAENNISRSVRNNKFTFLPKTYYADISWDLPEGCEINTSDFLGFILKSEQYSLTKDAYTFWKGAEDQLNASGKLFDPVECELNGNISCTNKPNEMVLGVFCASDVKIRYDYLYISKENFTYGFQMDSFPEILVYDTNKPPKGWIVPPNI